MKKFWKKKANIILVLLLITGLFGFVLGVSGSASKLSYLAALGNGGVVFVDGFDNGNLDAWSAVSGNPLIESQVVSSGSYALDGGEGYVYKVLDVAANDIFFSFSVWFSSVPENSYSLLGSIWDNNFGDEVSVIANTFGGSSFDLGVNGAEYQFLTPILAGQWYNLVVERNVAGVANLWVNDVSVLSVSGVSIAGAAQIVRIGGGWGGSTYYDNVQVEITGPFPTPYPTSSPTVTPTPVPTVTPSPTINPTPTPPPVIIEKQSNINTIIAVLGAITSFLSLVGLRVFNGKW